MENTHGLGGRLALFRMGIQPSPQPTIPLGVRVFDQVARRASIRSRSLPEPGRRDPGTDDLRRIHRQPALGGGAPHAIGWQLPPNQQARPRHPADPPMPWPECLRQSGRQAHKHGTLPFGCQRSCVSTQGAGCASGALPSDGGYCATACFETPAIRLRIQSEVDQPRQNSPW